MTQSIKLVGRSHVIFRLIKKIEELNDDYDKIFLASIGGLISYETKHSVDGIDEIMITICAEDDPMIFYTLGLRHAEILKEL